MSRSGLVPAFNSVPSPYDAFIPLVTSERRQECIVLASGLISGLANLHSEHDLPLICYAVARVFETRGFIPRPDQLEGVVQLVCRGLAVIHIAATASGKTLIIAMVMLLFPELKVVIVSPLALTSEGLQVQLGGILGSARILYQNPVDK